MTDGQLFLVIISIIFGAIALLANYVCIGGMDRDNRDNLLEYIRCPFLLVIPFAFFYFYIWYHIDLYYVNRLDEALLCYKSNCKRENFVMYNINYYVGLRFRIKFYSLIYIYENLNNLSKAEYESDVIDSLIKAQEDLAECKLTWCEAHILQKMSK